MGNYEKGECPAFVAIVFPLWGIPFVLIGLYMIFGRFFVDAWMRERLWYGVTDRRALIVSRGINRKVTSFDLRSVGEIQLSQHSDGTGTITFGPIPYMPRNRYNRAVIASRSFDHVRDAAEGYRVVRQVQQGFVGGGERPG